MILRLLVIEDDAQLEPWLRTTLENALGGAYLVTTLDEAKTALAVREFDLVVMDRRLPDGDAIGLIGHLRHLRPRPNILVLTALDDPSDIAKALDAGAGDYLGKPFEPIEVSWTNVGSHILMAAIVTKPRNDVAVLS